VQRSWGHKWPHLQKGAKKGTFFSDKLGRPNAEIFGMDRPNGM